MKRSKVIAVVAAGLLAFSSMTATAGSPSIPSSSSHTPAGFWVIFGCAGGVIFAALSANYTQRRQLTWNEAATCGLLYWFTLPPRRP